MKPHVIATVLRPESPVRCSICLLEKSGRVYDAPVALWDETGCTARTHGIITVCQSCRRDFDAADNELDADDIERHSRGIVGCRERACTCHEVSAWADPTRYPNGCSSCGCHRDAPRGAYTDDAFDQLYDDAGIYPPERNEHWTFPKGGDK